jgi:hydrogenase-1 operon protein HyaF
MTPFTSRVGLTGPRSHPQEDGPQCLEIPREVSTFGMPRIPERADPDAMVAARDLLAGFLALLEGWTPAQGTLGPCVAIEGLTPAALDITNQVLGEGEVSIRISGERDIRIQESVFTGLWRVQELGPDGALIADTLEAGRVPAVVGESARAAASATLPEVALPAGVMNAPALLREIEAQALEWRTGRPPHVVNLTLLPMTPVDHAVLEQALPSGPVAIASRGFGNCRITSTRACNVWRLQHFNSVKTLILNTIVVCDVPEEAAAAPEDLEDSRQRLAELIEWMSESCPP